MQALHTSLLSYPDSPVYAIKVSTRAPTQSEDEALSNSPSMSVLDERLNNIYSSRGDVSGQIFAYHTTNSLSSNEDLQLGRHRAVFFSGSTDETSLCNLVQSIRESVLGEEEVDHMMRSIVVPQHEKETERYGHLRTICPSFFAGKCHCSQILLTMFMSALLATALAML